MDHAANGAAGCFRNVPGLVGPAPTAVSRVANGTGWHASALEKFNLQSGQRRAAVKTGSRHRGAVRGLATEALSKCVSAC